MHGLGHCERGFRDVGGGIQVKIDLRVQAVIERRPRSHTRLDARKCRAILRLPGGPIKSNTKCEKRNTYDRAAVKVSGQPPCIQKQFLVVITEHV